MPVTPFGGELTQQQQQQQPQQQQHHSNNNGPGESTPAAAFGWTGLDDRAASGGIQSAASSRINNWWMTFDAQYMQPVFGGPRTGQEGTPRSTAAHDARLPL